MGCWLSTVSRQEGGCPRNPYADRGSVQKASGSLLVLWCGFHGDGNRIAAGEACKLLESKIYSGPRSAGLGMAREATHRRPDGRPALGVAGSLASIFLGLTCLVLTPALVCLGPRATPYTLFLDSVSLTCLAPWNRHCPPSLPSRSSQLIHGPGHTPLAFLG